MKTPPKKSFEPLDEEEKEWMDSVEKENWVRVESLEKIKEEHAKIAEDTFAKSKRINIR
ncbi:MAG: antitoxin, partial [Bacteroidetes bacterium]|nr:antitoxin [Bacteroidota bacterium]